MKILTVDISKPLASYLSEVKYLAIPCEVDSAHDLFGYIDCEHPGVVIVNADTNSWVLSDIKSLRSRGISTPVIALVSSNCQDYSERRIDFIDKGGNDLFQKPFNSRELLSVARSLYCLYTGAQQGKFITANIGSAYVELDECKRTISVDGTPLLLTRMEHDVLRLLIINKGNVVKRDFIDNSVHGSLDIPENNSVEVLVYRIRKKLGAAASAIETIRNVGYRLVTTS